MKIKHLRIISLSLFLITLLKLFLVDIKGISEGGKIAAFISLGVLLLVVSFMYQRLKKLLLADVPPTDTANRTDLWTAFYSDFPVLFCSILQSVV